MRGLLPMARQWGVINLMEDIIREGSLIKDPAVQKSIVIHGMENCDGIPMEGLIPPPGSGAVLSDGNDFRNTREKLIRRKATQRVDEMPERRYTGKRLVLHELNREFRVNRKHSRCCDGFAKRLCMTQRGHCPEHQGGKACRVAYIQSQKTCQQRYNSRPSRNG